MTSAGKMVCRGVMGFMVLALLTASHIARGEFPCGKAISMLSACEDYLAGKANSVTSTSQCCAGAHVLIELTKPYPQYLRNLCFCLKNAAAEFHVLPDRAKALPALCQLNVHIDPTVVCDKSI